MGAANGGQGGLLHSEQDPSTGVVAAGDDLSQDVRDDGGV